VRLCLDEHYSKEIANVLRQRGHDVDCVTERPELVSLADADVWARMQREGRTLLTENVGTPRRRCVPKSCRVACTLSA
jgi:hypothetical protein